MGKARCPPGWSFNLTGLYKQCGSVGMFLGDDDMFYNYALISGCEEPSPLCRSGIAMEVWWTADARRLIAENAAAVAILE